MKQGHLFWAKHREADEVTGLQELFNNYWSSNNHDFNVLSQSLSPTSPRVSSDRGTESIVIGKHSITLKLRFSANDIVRTFSTAHIASY